MNYLKTRKIRVLDLTNLINKNINPQNNIFYVQKNIIFQFNMKNLKIKIL